MTTEEKKNELATFCFNQRGCADCPIDGISEKMCCFEDWDDEEINAAYEMAHKRTNPLKRTIKDSGERREFSTGAVRDIQEGKGRCDLLPLGVVAVYMPDGLVQSLANFMSEGDVRFLEDSLNNFRGYCQWDKATMLLEVSKHFEEGAKKYGEYNWQKGIPTHCYIDSAVRHYLKWLRGDKDEPHDRAFCWNILCCIWTCQNKPELNDYAKEGIRDAEN